jgi:D-sedoheptulose 7-phosphate isomerase
MSLFSENLDELESVLANIRTLDTQIGVATELLADTIRRGNKIMFCGNGGSAADSQHLAAEFVGRFVKDRAALAAMALSTDSSALTCISNDYAFDQVFVRQVQGLGRPGDCLVGISTSGNSSNVKLAVEHARANGISVIGLLGRDGGTIAPLCDVAVIVPSATTARIQEAHILIGHTFCGGVETALNLA